MPAQTVRAVKQRSWGSGTRLAESWSIPAWLYYPGRVVGGLRAHPAWASLGACIVAGVVILHSLLVGSFVGVAVFSICLTWMVRSEQRRGEAAALGWPETFAVMRRRTRLRKQWPLACAAGKITGPLGKGPPALPRKVEITGPSSLKARINTGTVGVAVKSLQKVVDVLADVLGCHDVIVTPVGPGMADVDFHWADPVGRVLPLTNMPLAPKGCLAYGIRPDGRAAVIWHHMSVLIGGLTRHGKALALDTVVPTPTGWTTMGDIVVGDIVYAETGLPCTVTDVWAIRNNRPCYRVTFSDGTDIVADAEHQWLVDTHASRMSAASAAKPKKGGPYSYDQSSKRTMPKVMTTEEMRSNVSADTGHRNYSVNVAGTLQSPPAELEVPPYTLGAWLGDGHSAQVYITSADPEVLLAIESEGVEVYRTGADAPYLYGLRFPKKIRKQCVRCDGPAISGIPFCGIHMNNKHKVPCGRCGEPCQGQYCRQCGGDSLRAALIRIDVFGNKHIPDVYLRGSESQRRALLAGLLDTDGYCDQRGTAIFYNTNERLARDVCHLVATLGYRPKITSKTATLYGKDCGLVWSVTFTTADKVFRLPRKVARQVLVDSPNSRRRYITAITPVPSVPVRCIAVDSPSHLFLVGEACIPTHNSNLIWALLADANRQGLHTRLYVSDPKGGVEMDALEGHVGDPDMGTLEVRHYAKTPAGTLKMIESLEGAMHKREDVMKERGQRGHVPTKEDPLVVLILDETLALIELLKKGVNSPLGRIAFMGGAVGYVVWANLQVAQVETVGRFRDLVPQRVCFATPSSGVTNAVLGDGADALGAKCSRLPKGVGFSYADGDHAPTKYRAALVSDDETRLIAAGRIPRGMLSKNGQMRALYRWYGTDAHNDEVLLYVGKTNDLMGRTKEHMTGDAPWIGDVTHNRVEWFPDEKSVLVAEKKAIESEHPLYNIVHNTGGRHRFGNVPRTRADAKVAASKLKATANRARGL